MFTPEDIQEPWEYDMLQFLQTITQRKDEKGASAVEYGLLVAAIAALIVVIVFALGGLVKNVFKDTCTTIGSKASVSSSCASVT